jgi:hypothetical protein
VLGAPGEGGPSPETAGSVEAEDQAKPAPRQQPKKQPRSKRKNPGGPGRPKR